MTEYPPPVAGLKELGEENLGEEWLDYRARGIAEEHVPDLIRLARQWLADDDEIEVEEDEFWAPIHAWRALGQLRAVEAIEALLEIVRGDLEQNGDWALEEMPDVFGLIGPQAMPPLAATLRDRYLDVFVRWNAATSLTKIAQRYPETREEVVAALVEQLRAEGEYEDATLKGGVIGDLIELKATEVAPAIERAFAAGEVDESIVGDWEEVRYLMGLGPKPDPRRRPAVQGGFRGEAPVRSPKTRASERKRNKRKMAKQSKKKNRRKK